jgi:two-component system, OmpR family, response regulator
VSKEKIKILVVDDEESIVEFIKMGLESEGFQVFNAFDGNNAIIIAKAVKPQVVILDVMLPGMNGCEVCVELKKFSNASIIMLTAKDDVEDRIDGLNKGADDYMCKPFSFKELLARINARIRNSMPELSAAKSIGDFKIDENAHEIFYKGKHLELSLTEYNLLKYLLYNRGIVLSKQSILDKVWGVDFMGDENIVEVYIRYLRNKIGDRDFKIIRTVRGVGYKVAAC